MTTETSIYEYAKQGLALSADKPAIWFYGKCITYRELFEKIDNVADHLYQRGVREGTVVTIHLPNCPQAVIAIYAVAKLGGICNMVHPLLPEAALRKNMAFTESKLLITHQAIDGDKVVLLETFAEMEVQAVVNATIPDQRKLADKCVLYLHSSGTTGTPKTVMHCHAAMNRIVENTFELLHCRDFTDQVVLAELPLFHGFGLIDNLHDAIAGGGQLVQMTRWDSRLAAKWIDQFQVTFMAGPPKFYYDLLDEHEFSGESLTHCYVGGDAVDPLLKIKFNERMKRDSLLFEGYGMTEVIAYCCSCSPFDDKVDSSGRAMPGTRLAVQTEVGIRYSGEGELLVDSNTMMIGYYRDEEDCFLIWNGKKWLKTGDYVRLSPDGYVYFVERLKNIIVRNGYNIFPSEIEGIGRKIDGVCEVCAIGVPDGHTQKVILFVESNDKPNLKDFLYRELEAGVPTYAIPSEIYFVKNIPRNPTGKVDKIAMRKIYEQT